jgi:hypothetical protein
VRLTFRSKLLLIVGATTVAFALVIVVSSIFSLREERSLELLEENLVPRLELGPQLEGDLAQLTRSMQDAAAAQDAELLERAAVPHARLLARLRAAGSALDPRLAGEAATAVDGYFQSAQAVVRRMIAGETGEAMVDAMAAMQARQVRPPPPWRPPPGWTAARWARRSPPLAAPARRWGGPGCSSASAACCSCWR